MVKTNKTWETVFFHAHRAIKKRDVSPVIATVELQYNHSTGRYTINTPNQEMVRFNDDPPEMLELKLEAVTAAVKYVRTLQKKKL